MEEKAVLVHDMGGRRRQTVFIQWVEEETKRFALNEWKQNANSKLVSLNDTGRAQE